MTALILRGYYQVVSNLNEKTQDKRRGEMSSRHSVIKDMVLMHSFALKGKLQKQNV